jgi:hypothetical protein
VLDPKSDTVMRWTCPSCHMEWLDRGRGFHGQRFSICLQCGTEAVEPRDARPALAGPRAPTVPAATAARATQS